MSDATQHVTFVASDAVNAALQLESLLDEYREETACKTYNGWARRRDPSVIRKDINTLINGLRTAASPVPLAEQEELELFLEYWVKDLPVDSHPIAKSMSRKALLDERDAPLLVAAWAAWRRRATQAPSFP